MVQIGTNNGIINGKKNSENAPTFVILKHIKKYVILFNIMKLSTY